MDFSDSEMPYIVRFFLQKEDQIGTNQGSECSGTIIDNHWIVTSFACCENIAAFKLLDFGRKRMTIVKQGQGSTVSYRTTSSGPERTKNWKKLRLYERGSSWISHSGLNQIGPLEIENQEYDVCLIRNRSLRT